MMNKRRRTSTLSDQDSEGHLKHLKKLERRYETAYQIPKAEIDSVEALQDALIADLQRARKDALHVIHVANYYTTAFQRLHEDNQEMNKTVARYKETVEQLKEQLYQANRNSETNENKVELLQSELTDTEFTVKQTLAENKQLQKQLRHLQGQFEEIKAIKQQPAQVIVDSEPIDNESELKDEIRTLRIDIERFKEENEIAMAQVEEANALLQGKETLIQKLKSTLTDAKEAEARKEREIHELRLELEKAAEEGKSQSLELLKQRNLINSLQREQKLRRDSTFTLSQASFVEVEDAPTTFGSLGDYLPPNELDEDESSSSSSSSSEEISPVAGISAVQSPKTPYEMTFEEVELYMESLQGIDIKGFRRNLAIRKQLPLQIRPVARRLRIARAGDVLIPAKSEEVVVVGIRLGFNRGQGINLSPKAKIWGLSSILWVELRYFNPLRELQLEDVQSEETNVTIFSPKKRTYNQIIDDDTVMGYFTLTFQSEKLNSQYKDQIKSVSIPQLYQQVLSEEIPFNHWHKWLADYIEHNLI